MSDLTRTARRALEAALAQGARPRPLHPGRGAAPLPLAWVDRADLADPAFWLELERELAGLAGTLEAAAWRLAREVA